VAGTNLRLLLHQAAQLLSETPLPEEAEAVAVYRVESDPRAFQVKKTDKGWQVIGEAIERAAAMTYWEYDQSVRRFQRILETLGVEEALRKSGVQEGDTVMIGEYELEWRD
jgi:GTP-binding protein